jgi:DNA repair protein RecO (recombination protein O)
MGFQSASGVVLNRRIGGEGDLLLTLFLKGMGKIFVSARGAATGKVRFGGGTEPLVWGTFALYQSRDGEEGKKYLKSVDVADDMLKLRRRGDAVFAAVRWAKLLMRHLLDGHPSDDLLANLYWSMKLLSEGRVPVEAAEWRFLWRWLKAWGLAPDLRHCAGSPKELALLRQVAAIRGSELNALTTEDIKQTLLTHRGFFAQAARRAEEFLKEP